MRSTKGCLLLSVKTTVLALYLTSSSVTFSLTPIQRLVRIPRRVHTVTARPSRRSFIKRPQQLLAFPVGGALAPAAKATFWQLATAFCLGGLFFSSVVATIGAVYSFGLDNVLKLIQLIGQVMRRVLLDFLAIFAAFFSVLFGRRDAGKWVDRCKKAWKVLKRGLGRAKREIGEGVDAVRLESQFIAGAVGPPGLQLAQYALDRLTPLTFGGTMEQAFKDACAEASKTIKQVRRVTPASFDPGTVTPKLGGARFFDLGADSLAVDVLLKWDSKIVANADVYTKAIGARIPVTIQNVRFEGPVRILVTSLQKPQPGFGAMLVSLAERPKLGLDVKVLGGEITKVPWLKSEFKKILEKSIDEQFLWPRRLVIPALKPPARPQPVLSSMQLDLLQSEDPLLIAEKEITDKFGKDVSQYAVAFPGSESVLDVNVGDDTEEEEEQSNATWWDRMWKPKIPQNATSWSNHTRVFKKRNVVVESYESSVETKTTTQCNVSVESHQSKE